MIPVSKFLYFYFAKLDFISLCLSLSLSFKLSKTNMTQIGNRFFISFIYFFWGWDFFRVVRVRSTIELSFSVAVVVVVLAPLFVCACLWQIMLSIAARTITREKSFCFVVWFSDYYVACRCRQSRSFYLVVMLMFDFLLFVLGGSLFLSFVLFELLFSKQNKPKTMRELHQQQQNKQTMK